MNAQTKIEPATLASAMAAAFGEIEAATKSNENAAFKQGGKASKYADIGAVIAAIKPALINHGLFFTQHPKPSDKGITVETVLHHANGDQLSLGELFVPANKQDAQGFGSALTYARRYALVTAFGVPTEDDDGNAAARGQSQQGAVSPEQPVSDPDVAKIIQLCEAVGGNQAQLICEAYKVSAIPELTAKQGGAVIERLTAKMAERAKESADA